MLRSPVHALISPLTHVAVLVGAAIAVAETAGKFVAFDAVCPHAGCTVAGCTVGYDRSAGLIVCPCHGSEFNAATGAPASRPSPHKLTTIAIAEGSDGQLYVS